MKKLKLIYLTFILFLIYPAGLQAQEGLDEQVVVPLSNSGKPGKLEVSLVNGAIMVSSYEGKEVIIQASSKNHGHEKEKEESKNGMKRIPSRALGLTVIEENNHIRIKTETWHHSINLDIKVPRNFSLDLKTVNNGVVNVSGVQGEHEISNVNGGITLEDISGTAVVNTVNGNVKVVFNKTDPDQPMAFSTLNGNVDVTFPPNTKATVKVKSTRGDIFTDFDIDIEKSKSKTERDNEGNAYKISIEEWVYGKINGGGPEILMKNMNGNIYIRKGK